MDPHTGLEKFRCPRSRCSREDYDAVDLWWTSRGSGGMGGSGPLLVSGGLLDQTYWSHVAFLILDDQYAKDRKDIERTHAARRR